MFEAAPYAGSGVDACRPVRTSPPHSSVVLLAISLHYLRWRRLPMPTVLAATAGLARSDVSRTTSAF